ncbi:hypothetical protein YC2023_012121 [Brassica napus]
MARLRSSGFDVCCLRQLSFVVRSRDLAVDLESSMALIQSMFVLLPTCPPLATALPPVLWVLLGCRSAPWFSGAVHVWVSLRSVGSTEQVVSRVSLA